MRAKYTTKSLVNAVLNYLNVAVKSSKPVLVKKHGKHTTVKSPNVLKFGRFLEFKNKKEHNFHKILRFVDRASRRNSS